VHQGIDEDEQPAQDGRDLVWVGRIDAVKAPHLAVLAAARLGRRIRIAGPVFDPAYLEQHRKLLGATHVELVGEIGGVAKAAELHRGQVFVYTSSRDYVEAGAAVFGEALRAGTPVAALAWRAGTCAEAALCPDSGCVALVDPNDTDDSAATALAAAIEQAGALRSTPVQEIGMTRFDPVRHFLALASRAS
jgi:glycosyltransferase involved in cell wall biosynthesis